MNLLKSATLALAITAVMLAAPQNEAKAAEYYYAVVAIDNPTDMTINYYFRWGNGEWVQYSVAPGRVRWHSWEYDFPNQNRSPIPHVKFDEDLSKEVSWKTYELDAYRSTAQEASQGKKYKFVIRDRGSRLDLVSTN